MSWTRTDHGGSHGRQPFSRDGMQGAGKHAVARPRIVVLATVSVLVVSGLLAACGKGEQSTAQGQEEQATITIDGQEANDHGSEDVAGATSIEFEMDDFYFEPTVLRGEAGQKLTLEAFNEGDEEHNITIEDQGVDEDLHAGDESEIDITFPESGTVVFFCEYHQDQGMRGALEVTG